MFSVSRDISVLYYWSTVIFVHNAWSGNNNTVKFVPSFLLSLEVYNKMNLSGSKVYNKRVSHFLSSINALPELMSTNKTLEVQE